MSVHFKECEDSSTSDREQSRLVLVLLVTITVVGAHRRFIGDNHVQKPTSSKTKLINLKSQVDMCLGKFLCGVRTDDFQCRLECIDKVNVCDGTMDCNDGRDEMNCPGLTTCPDQPCPEETPCPTNECPEETLCPSSECPEETPCPSSECPAGEIRCGDGSACKAIQDICDGTDPCPPGDTVDTTILQCMGKCPLDVSPDVCREFGSGGFLTRNLLSFYTGFTLRLCRELCNLREDCNAYVYGVGAVEGGCYIFSELETVLPDAGCNNPAIRYHIYYCTS